MVHGGTCTNHITSSTNRHCSNEAQPNTSLARGWQSSFRAATVVRARSEATALTLRLVGNPGDFNSGIGSRAIGRKQNMPFAFRSVIRLARRNLCVFA